MSARGGKAIYGAPLGILMLEARFPRIPGDMGNAGPGLSRCSTASFAAPRRRGSCSRARTACCRTSLEPREELVELGAEAITTNCGFLSLFQRELAGSCRVPVATSSLMQVPWVQATLPPGKRVGILTVCSATLTPAHLEAAGSAAGHADRRHRERARILPRADQGREATDMDVALAEQDILEAGRSAGGRAIPRSARSCSNAPTCRPMRRRCRRRLGCRSTTSIR